MRRSRKKNVISPVVGVALLLMLAGCTAPPGYHYETGGLTPVPNDPCMYPQMRSAGALSYLNAKVGKPGGPPAPVVLVENPRSPRNFLESPQNLTCHETIIMKGGLRQSGDVSIDDPGGNKPLEVTWISDSKMAKERKAYADARKQKAQACSREARAQIPDILGLNGTPFIVKTSNVTDESYGGMMQCFLYLHWSNGLVEAGIFREWRNDYDKVMVDWKRQFVLPPSN